MARDESANWMDHLPLVLLGMRSAWKSDLDCSSAELTFGTDLRLPGECKRDNAEHVSEHEFLNQLRRQMGKVRPTQASDHLKPKVNVPKAFEGAEFVLVRRDARAPPLSRPYLGPFKVIQAGPKYFELLIKNKVDRVSID